MRRETMMEIFNRSPEEAVEEAFRRYAARVPWQIKPSFTAWQSTMGIDGIRYGSFRLITREELARRTFEVEICDYDVGIFWTDTVFNPRGCQHILKKDYYGQQS